MTEFSDFLKHQMAYIAIGEFQPGKFAEAQRLFEKAVSTYVEGFKRAYLLQKPGTDEGIAIIIWNNMEAMEANQNEAHQKILNQMAPLFTQPPTTNFYEVSSQIDPNNQ